MSEFTETTPDDLILAEFLQDLDASKDKKAVLVRWIRNHPHLEDRLRGTLDVHANLDEAGQEDSPSIPPQLGEFKIVRLIAKGGMGEVYEAVQVPLNRRVAVKTIRHAKLTPELRQRFLREQKILGTLHQTNIVSIHTAGTHEGFHYLAMPYINGAALNHVVRKLESSQSSQNGGRTPTLGQLAIETHSSEDDKTITHSPMRPNTQPGEEEPTNAGHPTRLSPAYLQSVAKVMADVAKAVHHAHECRILHRDIKPSNIMVDAEEESWIIDFGLGKYLQETSSQPTGESDTAAGRFESQAQVMGTPAYMAPEQYQGRADVRTDVYGLGVTMYELLTLKPAFVGASLKELEMAVVETSPPTPRQSVPNIPCDLEAICLKAMRKEPARRYESADEFAKDLRRYLNGEPVVARPAAAPRRAWKWALRNKGWASAMLLFVAVLATAAYGGFAIAQSARRDTLILESERIRASTHSQGWSNRAWQKIQAAANIRKDQSLRNLAASTLAGVDASAIRDFPFGAQNLAFDSRSDHLLMSGTDPAKSADGSSTRLWGGELRRPELLGAYRAGPVAFDRKGEPLQLFADDQGHLVLLNVKSGQEVFRTLPPPFQKGGDNQPSPAFRSLVLSPSGTACAALIETQTGREAFIWQVGRQKPIKTLSDLTVMCFSSDGSVFATAESNGKLTIWNASTGVELATVRSGLTEPSVMSFTSTVTAPIFDDGSEKPTLPLLAVAASGRIVLFSLPHGETVSICRGFHHNVTGLSFSPDGTWLASCGRVYASLWDVSAGTEQLRFSHSNTMTDIAFAPDGQHIAVSHTRAHEDKKGGVRIWELEFGRGIELLRGFQSPVGFAVLSPKENYVAALSEGWKIAIWKREPRNLIRILDAPPGYFTDNAALRFSPDERQIIYSAGKNACLWDVKTGKKIASWRLPPGIQDEVAFTGAGKIHLFRMESASRTEGFLRGVSAKDDPRICRLYALVPGREASEVKVQSLFNRHVFSIVSSSDGKSFVAEGLSLRPAKNSRSIAAFDANTGELKWRLASKKEVPSASLSIDPNSKYVAYDLDGGSTAQVVEMETGRSVRFLRPSPSCFHMKTEYSAKHGVGATGFQLFHQDGPDPLVTFAEHLQVSNISPAFSSDGRLLVWGNMDGTVAICDLEEVLERLTAIGLSW